jgi:hypothetical protein
MPNCNQPVVLYRCETWCLTLREEHRLRVFENGVLRRIFGPKRDEVTGGWRTEAYRGNDNRKIGRSRIRHDTLNSSTIVAQTIVKK